MNKRWLISILIISFALLAALKAQEVETLTPFFRASRSLSLKNFASARKSLSSRDQELLKLWESMLTGKSRGISSWMKERYRSLGLSHLFTPSGLHISAILFPFMKILKGRRSQFFLILLIGLLSFFIPGMSALKRMLLIKGHQKVLGMRLGFLVAIGLDILFGSFQEGTLSFAYSFLFMGIVYSGLEGMMLIIAFFIGQMMIAYFQGNDISPLLLITSPVLNLAFSFSLPFLFLLALPLWNWQLYLGLGILRILQFIVDSLATLSHLIPSLEINVAIFFILYFLLKGKTKVVAILVMLCSFNLNLDFSKMPSLPTNDFSPKGRVIRVTQTDKELKVVREDGNCKMRLVRGFWWENCSPKRRSSRKRLKRLSYL